MWKSCVGIWKKNQNKFRFGEKKENENLDVKSCMVWFWVLNINFVLIIFNG